MTFLTGSLLFGLLAAAVPVIIHLMHRQRTVPVRWGAMQFLLESQLQFRRRRKVDHWLLLLARIAMLALLAFLLARPLLKSGPFNLLPDAVGADVVVVVDRSLSAGRSATAEGAAAASGVSVFARGVTVVETIAGRMRPNDTLGIVLSERRPDTSITPLPVRSGAANDALNNLRARRPGNTAASIPDAVQAARELLARGPNSRKIILVLTDEQRNAWQIDQAGAWSGALGDRSPDAGPKVFSVPIPVEPSALDVAVGDLSVEPSIVGVARPAQITATLTNRGPLDVPAVSATLVVGGTEAGRQSVANLKPGSSQAVRFDHVFANAGSNWVQVRAEIDDALEADNAAVIAVNVRQRLPVLVIDGQLSTAGNYRSSQFLLAAMQPVADESRAASALIQPKVISASAAESEKLGEYAAVVVNDVPQLSAATAENLAAYVRSGHGVWIILGPRCDPSLIGKQLAQVGLLTADFSAGKRGGGATPPPLELKSPQNPMVSLVAAAERNAMTGAATRQWWSIVPRDGDEQVVLSGAGAANGDPLVLERPAGRNGGRVVVWCTSVDGLWNNWPLMPNFVPLVNETVYHLAGAGAASSERRRLEAGMPIEWSLPPEPRVKTASLTRPDGSVAPQAPAFVGGRQRVSHNDTAQPGLYTLRFEPTEIPQPVYFGVGIDRRELDDATLTEADYAWLKSGGFVEGRITSDQVAAALGGAAGGAEIWRWLALGVLALLVFESVMTRRIIGLQAAPGEAKPS